jgi:hypothetical protein
MSPNEVRDTLDMPAPDRRPQRDDLSKGAMGAPPPPGGPNEPSRNRPRVFAKARPGALPIPAHTDVSAFTKPQVFDKWSNDAAGVRAVAMGDNVITMFDVIGEDFWSGGGITAKKVASQLRAIGDRPVEVQINSPGGDMFEGIAIYNVLREHPQPITVKVMGMAASAASSSPWPAIRSRSAPRPS